MKVEEAHKTGWGGGGGGGAVLTDNLVHVQDVLYFFFSMPCLPSWSGLQYACPK